MLNSKLRILIAEDEKIIALDIKKTLQRLGYDVLAMVTNGEQALKFIEGTKPDLILMDIMLKGTMSGIDTAKIISQKFKVPFVYLTALTDEETLSRAKITEPFGYVVKPFNERGLHSAIEMAIYKHKVENELKRKTEELEEERIKTDQLLHNILPADVIKELKEKGTATPRLHDMVSILFTDFCDFSKLVTKIPYSKLLKELDEIFTVFDSIVDKYGLEKMKTIGDLYMVAGGLPAATEDHAIKIICAVTEMMNYINSKNETSKIKLNMRAGVNSGPIVAGIVGSRKFSYDVWGDTVNIASRMGSSSIAGRINISESTYHLIKNYFDCELHGKYKEKGRGEVDMYFILNPKAGLNEVLPCEDS
jgi:class 3 adenylate cyclase